MPHEDPVQTRHELRENLRSLGLEAGYEVVVHPSLSSLGWVEGGADTVVDALLDVLGDRGTLAVPTFTSGLVESRPFDRCTSPSQTGAITEAVRCRASAVRSSHPTHSVTAIGCGASAITRAHPPMHSVGRGSPLHRLANRGGWILLVGVRHDRNSTIHVAERLAGLPFKGMPRTVPVRRDGDVVDIDVARVGCSRGFTTLEAAAEDAGIVRRGPVGVADCQLLRGDALIDLVGGMLSSDPGRLLCETDDCWWCADASAEL